MHEYPVGGGTEYLGDQGMKGVTESQKAASINHTSAFKKKEKTLSRIMDYCEAQKHFLFKFTIECPSSVITNLYPWSPHVKKHSV